MARKGEYPTTTPSPLGAGLATGAVAGAVFGGPIGLLAGLAQGIIAKRMRESELDYQAQEAEMLSALDEQQQAAVEAAFGLGSTEMDQAQLDQDSRIYMNLRQLASHPDPNMRARAIEQLATHGTRISAWLEDIETRNESQFDANVATLDKESDLARASFDEALSSAQETKRVASELHQLLADDSFDVNHPLNRGRLGALFEQTPRELLSDPEDMADALKEAGGQLPLIGAWMTYSAGKQAASDFVWTKEDWRKIAFAMQTTAEKKSKRAMDDAIHVGMALDQAAGGFGHKPAYSYIERIATGRVQDGPSVSGRPGAYRSNNARSDAAVSTVRETVSGVREASSSIWDRLRRIGANPNPPPQRRRVND
jgi:hypothetical protein